jgi:hypothetical protein
MAFCYISTCDLAGTAHSFPAQRLHAPPAPPRQQAAKNIKKQAAVDLTHLSHLSHFRFDSSGLTTGFRLPF